MRYPASEKLEIIRIVEQAHLPAKRTLDQLGIARRTFYRWYDRYCKGGPEALEDRPSVPGRPPDILHHLLRRLLGAQGFWSHLRSFVTTTIPKPSLNHNLNSGPQALTADRRTKLYNHCSKFSKRTLLQECG